MKLILIRSPQLFFYKMKSKKKIKNMTTDTITGNWAAIVCMHLYFDHLFLRLPSLC